MPLLFNSDIGMLYVEPDENDVHFYRNSQADECVYVVEGKGVLETVFGDLPFQPGDYVVIHRNITHRWRFDLAASRPSCWCSRAAGTSGFPRATRTTSASCSRARRSRSATSGGPRSCGRATRWATSRSW